jgi:hypothetical protein
MCEGEEVWVGVIRFWSAWAEVRDFEAAVFQDRAEGQYLLAIIDSVMASSVSDQLAVTTSMHDLVIAPHPVPDPPMDVLIVRAPGSLHPPKQGSVLIEYLAVSELNTSIERPTTDAVGLFWRFLQEKFEVAPSS